MEIKAGIKVKNKYKNNDGLIEGVLTSIHNAPGPFDDNQLWHEVTWSTGRVTNHSLKDITSNFEAVA